MSKFNMRSATFFLLFATSYLLVACGTKGPLYIPEQRYPQDTQPNSNDSDKEKTPVIPPVETQPTVKDY